MRVRDESFSDITEKTFLSIKDTTIDKVSPKTGIIKYKLDSENRLIFSGCNSNCSSILGIDCEEFIDKRIDQAFPSLVGTGLIEKYTEVAVTGNSWGTEYVEYKDNAILGAYKVEVHQIESDQIILAFTDLTEQKRIKKNDTESLSFLNSIYNGVEHLIFVISVGENGSFRFVDVNPAYEKVAQLKAKNIKGKSLEDFIPKVSKESIKNTISKYKWCTETKISFSYEEMISLDGVERWWLTTLNPVIDNNNNVTQIIGTSVEITDRKNVEQELIDHEKNLELTIEERTSEIKESELRFRKMAEGLYEGIRIYENDNLIYVNETFCKMLEYTAEELKMKNSIDLIHDDYKEKALSHIDKFNSTNEPPEDIVFGLVAKDGSLKKIKNRYITWKKDNGKVILNILSNDVTEKEENEDKLQLQSAALNAAANGISISDNSGNIIWVNDAFLNLTGYEREELVGNNPKILKSGMHNAKYYDDMWKTVSEGSVWRGEFINKRKNGDFYYDETTITPLIKNGVISHFIEIKQDISKRKTYEANLKHREEQYSTIFKSSTNGIMILDKDFNIIDANPMACKMYDFTLDEIKSLNISNLTSKRTFDQHAPGVAKAIDDGKSIEFEAIDVKKGGKEFSTNISLNKINYRGETYILDIVTDITERKKVEEALREREEHYRTLFENSHNAIFVSDFDGNILEINNSAKELFGLNGEKISDLNSFEFVADKNEFRVFLAKIREQGFVKAFSSKIRKKNNTKIDCLINATLHKVENSKKEVFQAILIDISDVIKAKHLLEDALKESEKANKLKSEFLGAMSHEIRTPINIILSYLGLIKSDIITQLDEDLQGLFPSMEKAGKRIIRTIDLLLNVAELNTGTYEGKFENVNLYERVLESIYLDYRKEARQKGLEFNLIKQTEETTLNIDEYTVNEVFKNLIDNAVKYTNQGKVEIRLKNNLLGDLEVEVKDTGIGIDASYLPDLFEPFTQEEMGYTRKFEGNGLGMALVKQYVKLNNAEIQVSSAKGVGTSFIVTFRNNKEI